MKTLTQWLNEYAESHQNPTNKMLHWLCVPQIVFTVVCALKAIPLGTVWIDPATVVGVLALAYYARLSWQLAAGLTAVFGLMYWAAVALQAVSGHWFLWIAAAIFVEAWIGQFIGHHYEGARPSFFKDLQFLLIGPLWLMSFVYRKLEIPMGQRRAHA